tara:strand:- start:5535 stop:5738 length:204 start_codon:yes stop_codon:yes gene_type:complete
VLLIKVSAKLKVKCFLIRYFSYTQNVGQHAEKPTAHSGTFGFADTQSQRKKPKEPEFLPTLDRKLIN